MFELDRGNSTPCLRVLLLPARPLVMNLMIIFLLFIEY